MKGLGLIAAVVIVVLLLRSRKSSAARLSAGQSASGPSPSSSPLGVSGSDPSPFGNGPSQDALDNFAQAIFQYEGGQPGNINVRNNNPGNLRSDPYQTGTSSGYATFADMGDGWDALNAYVQTHAASNPQWDFYDFFQNYLGQKQGGPPVTDQGNSDAYAEYVANYTGADPTQPVWSFLQGA